MLYLFYILGKVLQYFGRLYHEYIVDNYSKIEMARLNYFKHNQQTI